MNLENGKLPYAMEKSNLPIMITFRYFRFISFIALQNLFFNLEHSREKKNTKFLIKMSTESIPLQNNKENSASVKNIKV